MVGFVVVFQFALRLSNLLLFRLKLVVLRVENCMWLSASRRMFFRKNVSSVFSNVTAHAGTRWLGAFSQLCHDLSIYNETYIVITKSRYLNCYHMFNCWLLVIIRNPREVGTYLHHNCTKFTYITASRFRTKTNTISNINVNFLSSRLQSV